MLLSHICVFFRKHSVVTSGIFRIHSAIASATFRRVDVIILKFYLLPQNFQNTFCSNKCNFSLSRRRIMHNTKVPLVIAECILRNSTCYHRKFSEKHKYATAAFFPLSRRRIKHNTKDPVSCLYMFCCRLLFLCMHIFVLSRMCIHTYIYIT